MRSFEIPTSGKTGQKWDTHVYFASTLISMWLGTSRKRDFETIISAEECLRRGLSYKLEGYSYIQGLRYVA